MQYYENNKVGKFWDETECLEKETKEILAKKILSLRQICLEKLENQEWTIQEYNDFIYIVKRMKLSRFSRFYDLIILYLNLSKEDCLLEIEKLSSSSLNGAYRVLRNLLNRAVIWDYIEYNPIHKVKCPSAKPRKEKETIIKKNYLLQLSYY